MLDSVGWQFSHSIVSPSLDFVKASADTDYLAKYLAERGRYDAIVDFLHTSEKTALERRIDLLLDHTDQFVFLSSYRTYADDGKIVTEQTPQWLDAPANDRMLAEDDYGIPKAWGLRNSLSHGGGQKDTPAA